MAQFRRIARIVAVQTLYGLEYLTHQSTEELVELALSTMSDIRDAGDEQRNKIAIFALELVSGVTEHLVKIDKALREHTVGWTLERMPITDRNILRLGAYELLCRPEIPVRVSLNEMVEISRLMGGQDTSMFVNGVLDALVRGQDCEKLKLASNF